MSLAAVHRAASPPDSFRVYVCACRLPADNAFHMSQLHIILDSTEHLLDDFASRLQNGLYDRSASE